MTGFAKDVFTAGQTNYVIELRSVNAKNFDCHFRFPSIFRSCEPRMRKLLAAMLHRGTVDCFIYPHVVGGLQDAENISFNVTLFRKLYAEMLPVAQELGVDQKHLFTSVLRVPQVMVSEAKQIDDTAEQVLLDKLANAIEQMMSFRRQEGEQIQQVLQGYLYHVQGICNHIRMQIPDRLAHVRKKLREKLSQLIAGQTVESQYRIDQEVMYYAERLDVSEELERLYIHISHFEQVLMDEQTQIKGKKLGFIQQEMGREVNTIGAKAQHSNIQNDVVCAKEYLEKIREQLANVL